MNLTERDYDKFFIGPVNLDGETRPLTPTLFPCSSSTNNESGVDKWWLSDDCWGCALLSNTLAITSRDDFLVDVCGFDLDSFYRESNQNTPLPKHVIESNQLSMLQMAGSYGNNPSAYFTLGQLIMDTGATMHASVFIKLVEVATNDAWSRENIARHHVTQNFIHQIKHYYWSDSNTLTKAVSSVDLEDWLPEDDLVDSAPFVDEDWLPEHQLDDEKG